MVPKSISPARQAENLAVFDFALTDAEMAVLGGLNINLRYNDVSLPVVWGTDIYA